MPFIKRNDSKGSQPPQNTRKIFIGRTNELYFFTEHILKPEDPAYNIVSLYGDGGVGKSTLINRFIEVVNSPEFKEYCLAAIVDERQATPASMMEKFTDQLHMRNEFKQALTCYKEALRKQQEEQGTIQDAVLQRAPDFAGAAVEGVPIVGPLLRESLKLTTRQVLDRYQSGQTRLLSMRMENPLSNLTEAFVTELNRLAESHVTLSTEWRTKRRRRIILIFDTFEQLSAEAAPWLLDYFLEAEISSNVVILTAGRIPIERSLPEDPKRWLPYRDNHTICDISLNSFTFEETQAYLRQRGVSDSERVNRIWQLSRGLPLYLSLLTSDPYLDVDPATDVVANFLRWIPQNEWIKRRLVLDAALFSRPFNQDDLAVLDYIPANECPFLYQWLITQPFVRLSTQDGRYSYHELAEDLFSRHLYLRSPNECYATRRTLANHYKNELTIMQEQRQRDYYHTPEWLGLIIALAQQLFFLPDVNSHLKAVDKLLRAYDLTKQDEEITRALRDVSQVQLYNQANADARELAAASLRYIEAEPMSQEHITVASVLLRKIDPTFSPTLLAHIYGNRGVAYRNQSDYQRAIEDFDHAISLEPDNAWAYGNRGITYRVSKNYDRALQDFNAAIALDDNIDWLYVGRGEVHRHLSHYDFAIQDFNCAITLDSNYAQAYGGRGRVYRFTKQYQLAIEDLARAIALDPARAWFHAQQGENYRDVKEYEHAIDAYNQAIALAPDLFFWAYGSRGYTYFRLKNYPRAIEDFDRALALDPTYIWGYGQRGRVYRHMKAYDKALADLNRAIDFDSNDFWAYSHRGLVYSAQHEYEKALADFKRAVEIDASYASAYGRRGSAYLGLGDLKHAEVDYICNCTMAPEDTRACWLSIWLTLCQQRPSAQTAIALESAAVRYPESYFAYLCRGIALWLRGQTTQALTELEEAQHIRPTMWDAPFWLTIIYGSQVQLEAVHALQRALEHAIPSVLLAPLQWLEADQPAFYEEQIAPLLAGYNTSTRPHFQ